MRLPPPGPGENPRAHFFVEGCSLLGACAVALVGAAAAVCDLRSGKVPNRLTLPAVAAGLVAGAVWEGWEGLVRSALGAAAGFGLLFLPALAGWVGGGDCKLLAAMGAFLGPAGVLRAALYGTALGGLGGLVVLLAGCGGPRGLFGLLVVTASGGRPALPGLGRRFPYAPFLALGGVLAAVIG